MNFDLGDMLIGMFWAIVLQVVAFLAVVVALAAMAFAVVWLGWLAMT
jgi:hypothetical protein